VEVLAVMGPTASGKTRLAVALAKALDGELINGDSRQSVAELSVGVCKPTSSELQGVPCHGLNWSHLGRPFTVAEYVVQANRALTEIAGRGRLPLVVGGTGLYIRALLGGFDFGGVAPSPERTSSTTVLAASDPDPAAQRIDLQELAPERAAAVDMSNPRRVARALELARAGARPGQRNRLWGSQRLACRLDPRPLRARIEHRSEQLMGAALADEVQALLEAGFSEQVLSRCAIGYAEALDWMAGRCRREEAVQRVSHRTWRYARAQMTWLRSEPDLLWVEAEAGPADMLAQSLVAIGRSVKRQR
jgi:tRNA dimethylallyltransferase